MSKNSQQTATLETSNVQTIEEQLRELKDKLKTLKAQAKEVKPKKGIPVRFSNKAGETIEGNGVLYYVVNQNGKLHYKEASQVEILEVK